jgi:alkylhydroperoxidase family enzyme
VDAAVAFATGQGPALSRAPAVLRLARAASTSPATIDDTTVAACRDAQLTPAAIVEVVCWLSVLQLLHRLTCWTDAAG